jgi:NAD-dependent deacetylase
MCSVESKMSLQESIQTAREMVSKAKRISALTGSGISVDSGIPDFRSEGGLWKRYDPLEYATLDSFERDPTKFWTMGKELAETILKAQPNPAHIALATLENQEKLTGIITLNIDNLHQSAGSKNVIELRGNYLSAHCIDCGAEYFGKKVHERVAQGQIPPKCEKCGGVLKSAAILFGEPLSEGPMTKAVELCRSTDLMIVIGTSLTIYPAAYLPQLAKNSGAKILLVNLDGNNKDNVADIVLKGRASDIIPKIIRS